MKVELGQVGRRSWRCRARRRRRTPCRRRRLSLQRRRLQAPSRRRRRLPLLTRRCDSFKRIGGTVVDLGCFISREKATADYQLRLLLQYAFGQNNYGQIGLGFAEPSTTVIRAPMSSSAVWGAVASYPPGISKLPVDRWCEQKDCEAVVGRDALCTVCQGDWRRFV